MAIFSGQNVVQFELLNTPRNTLVPVTPYVDFTPGPIVLFDQHGIVDSSRRKFDDAWVDTANFANSRRFDYGYPRPTIWRQFPPR